MSIRFSLLTALDSTRYLARSIASMICVVPVGDEQYRFISATFFAMLAPGSQMRECYLSKEMVLLLEDVLMKLMNGDRDTMRAFCGALYVEFSKVFPLGVLDCVYYYRLDRVIVFERDELLRIVVRHMAKGKEIVVLGIEDVSKMHVALPESPFSYRRFV